MLGENGRAANIAPFLALLSVVLYCFNGELLQALQRHSGTHAHGSSAFVNLFLCHIGGLLFIPYFLCRPRPQVSTVSMFFASIVFSFVLTGYNYMWLWSSTLVPVGLTNAVFQTSMGFVFLASTLLFGEKVTGLRLCGVVFALLGSFLASGLTSGAAHSSVATGVFLALMASIGYTCYQVLFRYWFGDHKNDVTFLLYFGAWVAVMHFVAVLPVIFLADMTGFEKFQLPYGAAAISGTIVSAIVAFAVNGLYLCIVMWGSPMLLPCASALSVPLGVALDMALHGYRPWLPELAGHLMVVISFVLIIDIRAMFSNDLSAKNRMKKDAREILQTGQESQKVLGKSRQLP